MKNGLLLWADDEMDLLRPHVLFLENKGYEVMTVTNGQDALDLCRKHTFDLIMLDEKTLVFVEVKTREQSSLISAQQAVTPAKQRRLISSARCYLGEHPEYWHYTLRFDVVTVTKEGVHHIPHAFQGSEW